MKFLALISTLCLTLGLAACGGDGSTATTGSGADASGSSKPIAKHAGLKAQIPKGAPPKTLVVKDLKVGTGAEAKAGERVTVQYIGVAYKTGKQFDARGRSEPFSFLIAPGQVQAGWIKGVPGMRVGGRRELIIPPQLTLNELGRPETLVYVIELLDVEQPPFPHISVPPGPPPKHVVVKELEKGSGDLIKTNEEIAVRYVSFDYHTGDVLEDHWGNDSIFKWSFAPGRLVRAWVKGLPGMREGGRRELIAPARLAYGTDPEIWVVELLSVGK